MAALPSLSGERAVRVFQKAGWNKDRQRGSHVILIKPSGTSAHNIAPGTLRAFVRRRSITTISSYV